MICRRKKRQGREGKENFVGEGLRDLKGIQKRKTYREERNAKVTDWYFGGGRKGGGKGDLKYCKWEELTTSLSRH